MVAGGLADENVSDRPSADRCKQRAQMRLVHRPRFQPAPRHQYVAGGGIAGGGQGALAQGVARTHHGDEVVLKQRLGT